MPLPQPAAARSTDPASPAHGHETGVLLRAACADFMNALFDAAATSSDLQFHARTLRLLRLLREQHDTILDALQADLCRWGNSGDAALSQSLAALLQRHFAPLDLSRTEFALLEAAFSQRLLNRRQSSAPHIEGDDDPGMARVMARLRIGNTAPPGSDVVMERSTASPPADATPPKHPTRSHWRHALLLPSALLLLTATHSTPSSTAPFPPRASLSQPMALAATPTSSEAPYGTPTVSRETPTHPIPEMVTEPDMATEPGIRQAPPLAGSLPGSMDPVDLAPTDSVAENATGPAAAATPSVAEAARPPSDPRLALQVEFLLHRGDTALAALRLTEPFPDSAAANYTAALALAPDDARAREGLERIVAAYAGLVRAAVAERKVPYALTLLERARAVQPSSTLLPEIEREITLASRSAR